MMTDKMKYKKILVLATHLIGDCLLATCITRSLRNAYPDAQIDVLVTNTGGQLVFKDNADINNVVEIALKPTFSEYKAFIKTYWRQYDLVVNDRSSDRSAIFSFLAGKKRIGIVDLRHPSAWIKKGVYHHYVTENDDNEHRLVRNLRILDPLKIKKIPVVNAPLDPAFNVYDALQLPQKYLVIHCASSNTIKQWPTQYWVMLINALIENNNHIVLTAGPAGREQKIVHDILQNIKDANHVINLAGQLSFPQLSQLLKNSQAFIGPDCGPAHLCSSFNIPIFSIFGPTPASMWAPWPFSHNIETAIFNEKTSISTVNNVSIFQSTRECVPCYGKHCPIQVNNDSQCLIDMDPAQVINHIINQLNSPEVN